MKRQGILGRKLGMTQIYLEDGRVVPVTVIAAGPCRVVQVKTQEQDGYESAQIGFEEIRKAKRVTKPMAGHFKKANVPAYRHIREIPAGEYKTGDELTVDMFEKGSRVVVTGRSLGKGFQGVMKRHNYSGGPETHGAMFHRAPGSIGQNSSPSHVFKNLGMPGRMGGEGVTIKDIEVVDVKAEQNIILLKGGIPGSRGSIVFIGKGGK